MRTKSLSLLAAAVAALTLPVFASVKFHSNSIKYRDSSKPHATGRSGSATLAARALVNSDRTADLQLTTGSFDPASSRGNIDKVQVKSESTGTINDNRLRNDGTYSIRLDAVDRGQAIDVLAHVSGIDGRRTDVVEVTETAKLRPDLHVTSINVPGTAVLGSPTLLSASIAELNGDVGARADCTLRVNGVTAATARRIWVDAGGTVSCSFLYTFNSAGPATVEISVRNVDPGDWDATNNALQASVNVTSNELDMVRWGAGSAESEWSSTNVSEASWGFRSEHRAAGWESSTYFHALWNDNLDINTLKATYVEVMDGQTMVELRDMPLRRNDSAFQGNGRGQCMVGISPQISAVICQRTVPQEFRPIFINPMFERRAGDATYFQGQWGYTSPGGTYVNNVETGRTTYGNQTRLGSNISLEVIVSDATRTYAERPSYAIHHVRTQRDSSPWRCWNDYWCGEWTFYRSDKAGSRTSPGY